MGFNRMLTCAKHRELGNVMIVNSRSVSFPHSLRFAQVRKVERFFQQVTVAYSDCPTECKRPWFRPRKHG